MSPLGLPDWFQALLEQRDQTEDLASLGTWLEHYWHHWPLPNRQRLPFTAKHYTRTCIARENERSPHCFEAWLMHWDTQAQTSIHGHPAFSFYAVLDGAFKMEFFQWSDRQGLIEQGSQLFQAGDVIWHMGQPESCDNFIHRVTCLAAGFTFHVYSDDAQRGQVYEPTKHTIFSSR
jgi:hypothetical protein